MEFIDLTTQQNLIREQLRTRIDRVLNHGKFILGPEVEELETRLARFVDSKFCVSVANGTDALQIAMMALQIGPGDEVITTPFSFIATVETIAVLGATPVFVDIDERTYNIDPRLIEDKITSRTKAIIPVSLYGQCADMDAINAIALRHKIPVIEDAAQSFGATYRGRKSCNLSTIATTSFFPSKPLGCYGDGGAIFTNDEKIAALIKQIRVHGQDRRYHHPVLGVNSRLDTLQAAILLAKLDVFEKEILLRQEVAKQYGEVLKGLVRLPFIEPHNMSVFAQYTIEVEDRSRLEVSLKEKGIPTAVHYPIPLHKQPVFEKFSRSEYRLEKAERAAQRVLSIPMHPYLDAKQQELIGNTLRSALSHSTQSRVAELSA